LAGALYVPYFLPYFFFVIYDTVIHRRLHPAFGWGLALIVLSQPLRLLMSSSDWWMSFAQWLTGTGCANSGCPDRSPTRRYKMLTIW